MQHTRSFYDRISRAYDLLADRSEHASRDEGLALLGVQPGERVLELGCGTGHGLEALAPAAGHALGLDLSLGMLAVSRERLAGVPEASLVHGDARQLPVGDATIDAIFLSFTLELFEEPAMSIVLAELRRILNPAGRVVVVAMLLDEHPGPLVELYRWLHRHFPHIIDCQPIDAVRALEGAGFRVETALRSSVATLPVSVVLARPA